MNPKLRHYLNIHRILWNWKRGHTKIGNYPLITSIELTDRCNLNCQFCARDIVQKHRGLGDMPFNEYLGILEKYPQCVRDIQLAHHGEPTQYSRLADAVQSAKEHGSIGVGFTTNGNFKTSRLNDFFEAGLTDICFSFEGTSPGTYESLRRGAKYDLIVENIKHCHNLKKKFPNIKTTINIIENGETKQGIPRFVEHWSKYVDQVLVSPIHDWGGILDLPSNLGYEGMTQPKSCNTPWFDAIVYWNGGVAPCCGWLTEPMGNVFKEDLLEIFNCQRWRELRAALNKGRQYHSRCKTCNMTISRGQFFEDTVQNPLYPLDEKFVEWCLKPLRNRLA